VTALSFRVVLVLAVAAVLWRGTAAAHAEGAMPRFKAVEFVLGD
jgi:hypothetical protein